MDKDKFEENMKECRDGNRQFHWNMAIFAGASLTLLLQTISQKDLVLETTSRILLRFSIATLIISLVASPLVNFISDNVTSYLSQFERDWDNHKDEAIKIYNKASRLTKLRFSLIWLSIICAFIGLILFLAAANLIYLK